MFVAGYTSVCHRGSDQIPSVFQVPHVIENLLPLETLISEVPNWSFIFHVKEKFRDLSRASTTSHKGTSHGWLTHLPSHFRCWFFIFAHRPHTPKFPRRLSTYWGIFVAVVVVSAAGRLPCGSSCCYWFLLGRTLPALLAAAVSACAALSLLVSCKLRIRSSPSLLAVGWLLCLALLCPVHT